MRKVAVMVARHQGQRQCQKLCPLEKHAEDGKQGQMQQEQLHRAMAQDQKVRKQRSQKHPLSWNAEKFKLVKKKKKGNATKVGLKDVFLLIWHYLFFRGLEILMLLHEPSPPSTPSTLCGWEVPIILIWHYQYNISIVSTKN